MRKHLFHTLAAGIFAMLFVTTLQAQRPENILTESSEPEKELLDKPLNDIADDNLTLQRRVLPYDHIREADVMWKKPIWRVIDVREKMNLPFAYPEMPFAKIIMDAAMKGEIKAYATDDDKFTHELPPNEVASMTSKIDTVTQVDPETYEEKRTIVKNDLNPEDVKQFRLKEIWFFDKETSTLQVRILGIAPLIDVKDDNGNFKYQKPLFWIYYPNCRQVLARQRVFNPLGNAASPITWENLLEMRFFSSYIYKEYNVYNRRLEDYLTGVDLLMEGEKIKQDIFNYEHDLWSY